MNKFNFLRSDANGLWTNAASCDSTPLALDQIPFLATRRQQPLNEFIAYDSMSVAYEQI